MSTQPRTQVNPTKDTCQINQGHRSLNQGHRSTQPRTHKPRTQHSRTQEQGHSYHGVKDIAIYDTGTKESITKDTETNDTGIGTSQGHKNRQITDTGNKDPGTEDTGQMNTTTDMVTNDIQYSQGHMVLSLASMFWTQCIMNAKHPFYITILSLPFPKILVLYICFTVLS